MHAADFTGMVPVHCHFFYHQDVGMIGLNNVYGAEGMRNWKVSQSGKCYNGAKPGPWVYISDDGVPLHRTRIVRATPANVHAYLFVFAAFAAVLSVWAALHITRVRSASNPTHALH